MKIKYNAPTTLSFSFIAALIVLVDQFFLHGLTRTVFTVPDALSFDMRQPLNYLRLFTHIAGHADWEHLMSNIAYILLLGPMLEETYGSLNMFLMILVTGFVTGVLNVCFFPQPLLGASGAVFMMILLASFTNHGKDDVPLTFILIVFLYLGREVINAFQGDDISQFAHLAGGLCGSLFGFFKPGKTPARPRGSSTSDIPKQGRLSRAPTAVADIPGPAKLKLRPSSKKPTVRPAHPIAAKKTTAESKKPISKNAPSKQSRKQDSKPANRQAPARSPRAKPKD